MGKMVLTKHYLILISAIILVSLPGVFLTSGKLPTMHELSKEHSEEMSEKYDQFIQLCKIEYLANSLADTSTILAKDIYYSVYRLSMNKRISLGHSIKVYYCPKAVLKYAKKQSQSTITRDSNDEPTEDSCLKELNALGISVALKEGVHGKLSEQLGRDLCPLAGERISDESDEEPIVTPEADQPKKPGKLCKWYKKMKLNCKHCFC